MSSFLLLRPLWLLALLPLLGFAYWLQRRRAVGYWSEVIDADLVPVLRRLGMLQEGQGRGYALLPLIAAGVMILALSGPALLRRGAPEYRALDPLILLLDMSPSVVSGQKSLTGLQYAAAAVLGLSEGRPVGVLLYAGDAYLASAPTSDAHSLEGLIAVLAQDTMPVAGSRPDMALSMARDLFATVDPETTPGLVPGLVGADLVIVSDGGNIGPRALEEASRLKNDGARVWAVALGQSAEGAPPPDPAALERLSAAGGGAMRSEEDVPDLMARIETARSTKLARQVQGSSAYHDFGPWLLTLALLVLFPLFRRRR